MVNKCGTFAPPLLGTFRYLPAGGIVEKLLYSLYADFLSVDKISQAPYPFDIIFRIVPVLVPSCGLDQTVFFIKSQCLFLLRLNLFSFFCSADLLIDKAKWLLYYVTKPLINSSY